MPRTITITIPEVHVDRIKQMLRESLGRELTPQELRYLGLSTPVFSLTHSRAPRRHQENTRGRRLIERKLA